MNDAIIPKNDNAAKAKKALEEYFQELYQHDNIPAAHRAIRKSLFFMARGCMTPGDFGFTEDEMEVHCNGVGMDYPLFWDSLRRFFERQRGY